LKYYYINNIQVVIKVEKGKRKGSIKKASKYKNGRWQKLKKENQWW